MFLSSTSVNSKILNKNAVVYNMTDLFVVLFFRYGYFSKKNTPPDCISHAWGC